MSRGWATVGVAALIAILAGCDGGSNGSPDTSTSTTTGTVPASSTSASTVSTAPSSTSTTAPPTTTPSIEAQVRAAYAAAYNGYWSCLRGPAVCDPTSLTASTGPARGNLTDAVNQLVASDLKVGPDDVGYMVVESVTPDATGRSALVKSCWWDTGVVYGPPATSGGDPTVVNDVQATSRFDTTMILEAGQWRISEETRTQHLEGVNQCPPEGS